MIATTDQQVQHSLALSDMGVTLLIAMVALGVLLWLAYRARPEQPELGHDWPPEEPRVVAHRRVFDQDCQHLARTRGDGWRFRCRDCGADLGQ